MRIGLAILSILAFFGMLATGFTFLRGKTFRKSQLRGGRRAGYGIAALIASILMIIFVVLFFKVNNAAKQDNPDDPQAGITQTDNNGTANLPGTGAEITEASSEAVDTTDDTIMSVDDNTGTASTVGGAAGSSATSTDEDVISADDSSPATTTTSTSDLPAMVDGALRAINLAEEDYLAYDMKYSRTFARSSMSSMNGYRAAHVYDEVKDEKAARNAFSISVIADQSYFDEEQLESNVNLEDIKLTGKTIRELNEEMAEQYAIWVKELKDLDPEDREDHFREEVIYPEVISNPSACMAVLDMMSTHTVFTLNNPWIKDDLKAMQDAYKINPSEGVAVGTATFLQYSEEHKKGEKDCPYSHKEINDEQFERACRVIALLELVEYEGVEDKTSVKNWALDIDSENGNLTQPIKLDKTADQIKGKSVVFSVEDNNKTIVKFGFYCYDRRLEEFDVGQKTTKTTTPPKKDPPPQKHEDPKEYGIVTYYKDKATSKDLINPIVVNKTYKTGEPYGFNPLPFEGYTFDSVHPSFAPATGVMGSADLQIVFLYTKNPTPTPIPTPSNNNNNNNNNGGGGGGSKPDDPTPDKPDPGPDNPDPGPDKPEPTPEQGEKKPENSTNNDPAADQPAGKNDNPGDGEQKNDRPIIVDTAPKEESPKQDPPKQEPPKQDPPAQNTTHEGNDDGKQATETAKDTTVTENKDNGDSVTTNPNNEPANSETVGGF